MKKLIAILLTLSLLGCNQPQKKYFYLSRTPQNEISYQFETYGLQKLELKLIEYKNNERKNSIPLGTIVYRKLEEDRGIFKFVYVQSNFSKKVIILDLNSEYFKSYRDTKILDTEINMSSYKSNVITDELHLYQSKNEIVLVEFTNSENSSDKFCIELEIII